MTRPSIKSFTAAGDKYFRLIPETDEPSPDFARPVLHVPADIADRVRVVWPVPTRKTQAALAAQA